MPPSRLRILPLYQKMVMLLLYFPTSARAEVGTVTAPQQLHLDTNRLDLPVMIPKQLQDKNLLTTNNSGGLSKSILNLKNFRIKDSMKWQCKDSDCHSDSDTASHSGMVVPNNSAASDITVSSSFVREIESASNLNLDHCSTAANPALSARSQSDSESVSVGSSRLSTRSAPGPSSASRSELFSLSLSLAVSCPLYARILDFGP